MKNYALIGTPVNQSPTPEIMNELFRMNGVDAFYAAIPITINPNFEEFQGELDGYNITYPFKRNAGGNLYIPGRPVESTDGEAFFRTINSCLVCSKPIALALKGFNGGAARSIRDSASEMFCNVIQWTEHAVADIYVNATPTDIEFEPPPNKDALVYDLNYGGSKLLESAKKAGFKTKNGKEMLVWNSILSFRKFIGKEPSAISRAHVLDKYCGVVK